MMQEITYSFIIPHKNCPDLLKRCVDSIPERDDVQIIVVDDNSDEGRKPLLPKRNGLEIVMLNASQSKGAGRARNVGLTKAEGTWLLFADADDYYCTDNLNILLDKYKAEDADMVILNAQSVDENGNISNHLTNVYVNNYKNKKFYSSKVIRYGLWTPWSRMVRRNLVVKYNLTFDEIPIGNDKMFSLNCSKFAVKLAVESDFIYYYFKPQGRSITDSYKYDIDKILPTICLARRAMEFYSEVGYIFKSEQLYILIKMLSLKKNSKKYINCYFRTLIKSGYPIFKDIFYSIVWTFGRLFKIV